MNFKNKTIRLLFMVIITVVYGLLVYCLKNKGFFISEYATWNNQKDTFVIGGLKVDFQLNKKKFKITNSETNGILFESPKGWLVSDYFVFNADKDDEKEIVLVLWKKGSFGNHKPFWYEEKDDEWTQHIFIYDWEPEKNDYLKPLWMSSKIGIEAKNIYVDEKNRIHIIDSEGEETIWQWISWGLMLMEVIPAQ